MMNKVAPNSNKKSSEYHTVASEEVLRKYRQPFMLDIGCFLIVVEGTARISINQNIYKIRPNTIITLLSHNIVQVLDSSSNVHYEVITFVPQHIHDVHLMHSIVSNLEHIRKNPVVTLTDDEIQKMRSAFTFFENACEWTNKRLYQSNIINNMVIAIFYGICAMYEKYYAQFSDATFSRKEIIVRDFLGLVFSHYQTERQVAFYADKLCITPAYLNTAVKEVQGVKPSRIITNTIIVFAKSELKSTNSSIKEIADKLNFPNPSFFCKFFKREVGITPMEYRNS